MSVTLWCLNLQYWDLRCAWVPLHFYFQGFHTSSTLFEPIHFKAPRPHSMSVGWNFSCIWLCKSYICYSCSRKNNFWSLSGDREKNTSKHMEIGESQDLMPTCYSHWKAIGSCPHLLLLWFFCFACPWVDNCSFMWMQAESVFYKRGEVSSILCYVTYWVCQGKVVPCKTDKGTAICSLWHHDKDGDSESADFCRYYH